MKESKQLTRYVFDEGILQHDMMLKKVDFAEHIPY